MDDATIVDFTGRDVVTDPLTDLLRKGARELLQAAVEAERDVFLAEFAERRTSDGRAAVVRSGYHPERAVQTRIGPVTVKVPKVRAKDGKPVTFRSTLVPPYVRKARSIEAALPWLYLKGISTGEMGAALKMLLGPQATGFSAKTISRLKAQWGQEYDDWRLTDLGCDGMGLCVGRWHLQRPAWLGRSALRLGRDRGHRAGREAVPCHRGRCAGKHPELARGAFGPESAWPQCPETGHW